MPIAVPVLLVRNVRNELIRTGTNKLPSALGLFFIALIFCSCATPEAARHHGGGDKVRLTSLAVESLPSGATVRIYTSAKVEFTSRLFRDPAKIQVEIADVLPEFDGAGKKIKDGFIRAYNVTALKGEGRVGFDFELASEAKFYFSQKPGFLEIRMEPEDGDRKNPTTADLAAENELLKSENEELKRQFGESAEQLREAGKYSQILKSRVERVEKQLDDLEEKIKNNERVGSDGSSDNRR